MKPASPSMKSAATAASVEAPAATTVASSTMLSKRHLRHPRKRKHRHNAKYNSNENTLFHITTLGSRTPQSLDVRTSHKDSKPGFYTRSIAAALFCS
jgi:hypothetical protein